DCCKRNGHIDHDTLPETSQRQKDEDKDQCERQWNDDPQAICSALQIFKCSSVADVISCGKIKLFIQLLPDLLHKGFYITSADIHTYIGSAIGIVTTDLHRPRLIADPGNFPERDLGTCGCIDVK